MLDIESVFSQFCSLSGLNTREAASWRPLCESSARLVESRLRKDIDVNASMSRLCIAAACAAYNAYLSLIGRGASGDEIRVGDITLKSIGGSIKDFDPLLQIADLLLPDGFAFVQTGVAI